jgi:hypothetical protein
MAIPTLHAHWILVGIRLLSGAPAVVLGGPFVGLLRIRKTK